VLFLTFGRLRVAEGVFSKRHGEGLTFVLIFTSGQFPQYLLANDPVQRRSRDETREEYSK
jgi:hypothetical protein